MIISLIGGNYAGRTVDTGNLSFSSGEYLVIASGESRQAYEVTASGRGCYDPFYSDSRHYVVRSHYVLPEGRVK